MGPTMLKRNGGNNFSSAPLPHFRHARYFLDIFMSHYHQSLGKLSSLTDAMKIHEVVIGSDLTVKKKNLPNDPFFKAVNIRESRRRSTVIAQDSGSDFDE